ncbi:MAG: transglycosylase domain-containing protein [Zetaproteobacteria bacterium]|nr:transglycosylase domain-containing protein [Zetaproteobacteria bacterium]
MKRHTQLGISSTIIVVVAGVGALAYLDRQTPSRAEIIERIYAKQHTIAQLVVDRHSHPLGVQPPKHPLSLPLTEMGYVPLAFLHSEDQAFWHHPGIHLPSILRALLKNMQAGRIVEGGSTITQQLTRMLFLHPRKTWLRKAQEAWTALKVERVLHKKSILELYLNHIYLGSGAYGVFTACMKYFDKPCASLSHTEAAMLAASAQAPAHTNPHSPTPSFQAKVKALAQRIRKLPQPLLHLPATTLQVATRITHMGWLHPAPFVIALQQLSPPDTTSSQHSSIRHSSLDGKLQLKAIHLLQKIREHLMKSQKPGDNIATALLMVGRHSWDTRVYLGSHDYSQQPNDYLRNARKPLGDQALSILTAMHLINQGKAPQARWRPSPTQKTLSLLRLLQASPAFTVGSPKLYGFLPLSQLEAWEARSQEIRGQPVDSAHHLLSPYMLMQIYSTLQGRRVHQKLHFDASAPSQGATTQRALHLTQAVQQWNGFPLQHIQSHHWTTSDHKHNVWLFGSTREVLFVLWIGKEFHGTPLFQRLQDERWMYHAVMKNMDHLWRPGRQGHRNQVPQKSPVTAS